MVRAYERKDGVVDEEAVASQVVDSALHVHKALGRGLLESAYQSCLAYELSKRGLQVECELPQPVMYDGIRMDVAYRLDMLIEGCVVIENKAVDQLLDLHYAQVLNYLHLRGGGLGFLINWNEKLIRDGIHRLKV
jgi:GxxExxY protein